LLEFDTLRGVNNSRVQFALLAMVLAVLVWSGIGPYDRFTWFLEVLPALIGLGVVFATRRSFPFTDLVYTVIAVHIVILAVGGHYTYANVPLFDWVRDTFDQARNNYDKVGHFWQGFGPALVAREVLLRTSPLRPGKWLTFLILCFALAVSAVYELIEWWVAVASGEAADAFLGSQGDPWDTQKDMFVCGIGATIALLGFGRLQDRALLEANLVQPERDAACADA
jgi:putative membrane protein